MAAFNQDRPIYLQIADRLCNEILSGRYKADERIPSVRDYAALLQVNSNTSVKAYEQLARDEIIYQRRGMGYYVSAGAHEQILAHRRKELMHGKLQQLFHDMQLLGISIDEVVEAYQSYQSQNK